MTLDDQIAYIEQRQREVRRFSAEMRALSVKDARTLWMYPVGGMILGAALFAAGMTFAKLIGM